jgi:hypothetical protein
MKSSLFPQFSNFKKDVLIEKQTLLDFFLKTIEPFTNKKNASECLQYLRSSINRDELTQSNALQIRAIFEGSLVLNNVDYMTKRFFLRSLDKVINSLFCEGYNRSNRGDIK